MPTTNLGRSSGDNGEPTVNIGGALDTPTQNAMILRDMVENAVTSRAELFAKFLDPRRDLYKECGYPQPGTISKEQYRLMYDREGVAARVVKVLPEETWKASPNVTEDEDNEDETEFETAWNELSQSLRGTSWYQDETGSPIWEHLKRADILCGIGHYGVILLGLDDGEDDLSVPAKGLDPDTGEQSGSPGEQELIYLRCFDESLAQVIEYEKEPTSPRYGQPKMYLVTFNDPNQDADAMTIGIGLQLATQNVHWTRIIHIADNLDSSETIGAPRMRPVYNYLYNLTKLYGGSAEMYWQGAFPGLSLETHPQLGGDVKFDTEDIRKQMSGYRNSLQRFFAIAGISAKSLAPQVVDPTTQIQVQIEAICIEKGIPKRIFMGSERGELASSQDDSTWNDVCRSRQDNFATPRIIVPFIDRLICLGVLPEPEGFSVSWPALDALTDTEQSQIAQQITAALAQYVSAGIQAIMTPLDFLINVCKFDDDIAKSICDNATDAQPDDAEGVDHPIYAEDPVPPGFDEDGRPLAPVDPNAPPGAKPKPGQPAPKGGPKPPPPKAG